MGLTAESTEDTEGFYLGVQCTWGVSGDGGLDSRLRGSGDEGLDSRLRGNDG